MFKLTVDSQDVGDKNNFSMFHCNVALVSISTKRFKDTCILKKIKIELHIHCRYLSLNKAFSGDYWKWGEGVDTILNAFIANNKIMFLHNAFYCQQ